MFEHGTYVYVDGESHYALTEKCLKNTHGEDAILETVILPAGDAYFQSCAPDSETRLFWHNLPLLHRNCQNHFVRRKYYFTTYTGHLDGFHSAQVRIRDAGFEPHVILEEKDKQRQRAGMLKKEGLLIKGKGVDVALAVRVLEDAQTNLFQTCALFTSDIDYLPLIEALRRLGKAVYVFGYPEGLSRQSPFMYAPDEFIDMSDFIRKHCRVSIAKC